MSAAIDTVNATVRKIPEWPAFVLLAVPPLVLLYLGLTGGLGVEPIEVMEHRLGLWGLQLLIATLLVTPLRRFAGLNLLKFRRVLGLGAFIYIVLHLTVWVVLDMALLWDQIVEDLVERWYIVIGMVGLLAMTPLAITSNAWSKRAMGRNWNRLHRLIYLAALAGGVHYVMQEKTLNIQALVYLGIVIVLVGLRAWWMRKRILPRAA